VDTSSPRPQCVAPASAPKIILSEPMSFLDYREQRPGPFVRNRATRSGCNLTRKIIGPPLDVLPVKATTAQAPAGRSTPLAQYRQPGATKPSPARTPLLDNRALELREETEHLKNRPAGRHRGVETACWCWNRSTPEAWISERKPIRSCGLRPRRSIDHNAVEFTSITELSVRRVESFPVHKITNKSVTVSYAEDFLRPGS
jgi:hypothetical protein